MSLSLRDFDHRPLMISWDRNISPDLILYSGTCSRVVNHPRVRYFGVLLGEAIAHNVLVGEYYNRLNSCGKTTLARLLAKSCDAAFKELSATDSGIGQLREAFEEAKNLRKLTRRSVHPLHVCHRSNAWMYRKTIIFFDEIHRFNKAQQVSELIYAVVFF
jgi:Holliday junction resolvasome RuvABC ATP-dependent DNA helicase subunit